MTKLHSERLIRALVEAHFQPVYSFFHSLTSNEDQALLMAQDAFVQAIRSPQVRHSGWCSRKDLFFHALQLNAAGSRRAPPERAALHVLRTESGLTAGELLALGVSAAETGEHDRPGANAARQPFDPDRLQEISHQIYRRWLDLEGGLKSRPIALETCWTVFVIGLILLLTYLAEARLESQQAGAQTTLFRSQPAPQAVDLDAGGLPFAADWDALRLVDSLLFPVASVGFSAAGQAYVTGHWDGWLVYCDFENFFQAVPAQDLNPSLQQIAVSDQKNLLATGTHAGEVVIWQLSDREPARRIFTLADHPGRILSLKFSPSGDILAAGTGRGTWLWQIEDLARRVRILPGQDADRIAFSPSGDWLATQEQGAEVWIRSLPDGRAVQRLTGFPHPIQEIFFGDNDRLWVALRAGDGLEIWQSDQPPSERAGRVRMTAAGFMPLNAGWGAIAGPALAADEGALLVGTDRGTVLLAQRGEVDFSPVEGAAFFERARAERFDSGSIARIHPGCSQAAWKRSLLNQNFLLLAGSGPAAPQEPSANPVGGAVLLGSGERQALVNTSLFRVFEAPGQAVYLVVHRQQANLGTAFGFDFLDKTVGARARIERIWLGEVPAEIVSGSWEYAITGSTEIAGPQGPPESVEWTAAWEPDSGRQTLRWQDGGALFELVLLPAQSGPPGHGQAAAGRGKLLDLAQEIILGWQPAP